MKERLFCSGGLRLSHYLSDAHRAPLQKPPLKLIIAVLALSSSTSSAITLDAVMDRTLEKNPIIQGAKTKLEEAAGQRLVLRSIMWPGAKVGAPIGVQGGDRAGESGTKPFGFGRGALTQALFNRAIPPSRRLGDVDLLIAEQQLNVAVVEQLHAARLAFYTALYNRQLQSIREDQRQRLDQNVTSQKQRYEAGLTNRGAFTDATVQARELDSLIETAQRAFGEARLKLAEAMGADLGPNARLPEPEGALQFTPVTVDLESETERALERRADLKLARLLVRSASEEQHIIEAGYYPTIGGNLIGNYVPVTGIHQEGSTSKTQDLLGSEAREGAAYTWRVIDNGKVTGAVRAQRAAREANELTYRKLEANVGRELLRIRNELIAIEARQKSFGDAMTAAEQSADVVGQNLAGGLASQLEYRLTQNGLLQTKSGLLTATYEHNLAVAEWDRATGRYFQFGSDTAP
ncbi:MAG: TolC family protein [Chthoniobacterales bacterium]